MVYIKCDLPDETVQDLMRIQMLMKGFRWKMSRVLEVGHLMMVFEPLNDDLAQPEAS